MTRAPKIAMAHDDPSDYLLGTLAKRRPTILLLGQSYLDTSIAENGFLKSVADYFKLDASKNSPLLDQLCEALETGDLSGNLRYLHRRSEVTPITEALENLSEFAWSSVFTSVIDEVWVRAFKKPWRSLNSIFTEAAWPLEARDPNNLCSTFLFGCVDKEDEDCRIPVGPFRFEERLQSAVTLLRRLPEVTTPWGVVLIDGYNPKSDWLKPKDLYPVLNALGSGQAFIFSSDSAIQSDKYLSKLADDGKLLLLDQRLSDFLLLAADRGVISFGDPANKLPGGRQITIDSVPHIIPKDLWQNLTGIATVLDDNVLIPPSSLSAEQSYIDYRSFLAEPVKPNNWIGFARGYVFERDFEVLLRLECEKRLRNNRLHLNPIILHGESGTGKTVAMADVAYKIASECVYPTLFIDRSVSAPDWRPIDRFLNWAEDRGASACLILWDGMRVDDSYVSLQRRLADRGRKVVVVGSTYLSQKPSANHIEAPRELNSNEHSKFKCYLGEHTPEFAQALNDAHISIDPTFLVALYRILPSTRPRLAIGISGELEWAGKEIFDRIKHAEAQTTSFNSLQIAFQQIPFFHGTVDKANDDATSNGGNSLKEEVRELIALVMVPGKYGFKVPIELLLSSLGRNINTAAITALQTGVLTWFEMQNGDVFVGPRHSLEAKMYLDLQYGGTAETEADYICKLIHGLKRGVSGEGQIDFIVDLLKHVGPNSPIVRNKTHFQRCILTFANALTGLRKDKSVISPRLMLQEATFYREAVKSTEAVRAPKERRGMLETAVEVLSSAKDRADCPEALKSSISAELAACYGSMIRTFEDDVVGQKEVMTLYSRARDALREAVRRNWANAHAVVTLGWISRNMLDSSALDEAARNEIQAELLFRFDDAIPTSFDSVQLDYFLTEKMRVFETIGKQDLADETFQTLKDVGSKAGYFLRARAYFDDFPDSDPSAETLEGMKRAESFLRESWAEVFSDERCLGLYLNVWWFIKTHQPRFVKERQILPFSDEDWLKLAEIASGLKALKEPDPPAWIKFLAALALFHCGDVGNSLREFRGMSSDINLQVGGNRLKKYYVASQDGVPLTYDGTVRGRVEENRFGEIWVNRLRHAIPIVPRDFDKHDLRQGETVADFHIAFSYAGPIAQPNHFLRSRTHQR
jgi:hypothetical protein